MSDREIVWRSPQTRHYRRYTNAAKFPYLVAWGNARLHVPAKLRTKVGALAVAYAWHLAGRRQITVTRRSEGR